MTRIFLLDETTRQIQVAVIHPAKLPAAATEMLPALPAGLSRTTTDALLSMRLPE